MKKVILAALLAIVSASGLFAQSSAEILKLIADSPKRKVNTVGRFTEVRTPSIKEQPKVTLKGNLVFKNEGFLNMDYDNGNQFTIKGTEMIVNQAGNAVVFDLTKNLLMKSLSSTLINSFKGRLQTLAEEQNADINAVREGKDYVVTLTARKKSTRGSNRIIVRYSASDCSIRGMQIDEVTGASTTYSME